MEKLTVRFILILCFLVSITSAALAFDFSKVKIELLRGDYKQAITEGEKILATQEEGKDMDELYYYLGLAYLKDGNYLRASDIFEIILTEYTDSKYKNEAKVGVGDTYFMRSDFDKAQSTYEELLKANPDTKLKAQLYYRLSQAGFKKGDSAFGKKYLDMLKQEFPSSPEAILNKELYPVAAASSTVTKTVATTSIAEVYYTVQVGSFSNKMNAENLVQKLIQESYPGYVETSGSQGSESYRVRVGKVASRQEAESLEKKLTAQGYPTKIFP